MTNNLNIGRLLCGLIYLHFGLAVNGFGTDALHAVGSSNLQYTLAH